MKNVFLRQSLLLILAFVMLSGCERTKIADTSLDEQQIKENMNGWITVVHQGDVDAYFNFLTEDFVIHLPNAKPIDNGDSLRSFLNEFFLNNAFNIPTWQTDEIIIKDDLAIHRYSLTAQIMPNNDTIIIEQDRKYLDVLRKGDNGEWRVYVHSFSTNQ